MGQHAATPPGQGQQTPARQRTTRSSGKHARSEAAACLEHAAAQQQQTAAAQPPRRAAAATGAATAAGHAAAAAAAGKAAQQHTQVPLGAAGAAAAEQQQQRPPWQKVLWRQQPYPDNHVDDSFLQHLVVNADVPQRDYWTVVLGSAAVTQQLATVVAATSVAMHQRLGRVSCSTLLVVNVVLLLIGYLVCGLLGKHVLGGSLLRGIRQVLLLSGGVYLMSPMLHSLTRNISGDSVAALIAGLACCHLVLHDYHFVNSVTEQLTGTLSLGAAVFAAVLFASRLPSELDVFAHILFCLQLFLLSPFTRRYVRTASTAAHVLLTCGMAAAAGALLAPLSAAATAGYVALLGGVSFGCPWWLLHIQKFKAKINGPWDEAAPKIPMRIPGGATTRGGGGGAKASGGGGSCSGRGPRRRGHGAAQAAGE